MSRKTITTSPADSHDAKPAAAPSRPATVAGLLVVVMTAAVYMPTLGYDFVSYDDGVYVTENSHVRQGLTWRGVGYAFTTGDTGSWQPLTLLSHMLDCSLFGMRSGGHHAVSVLLHVLNTILVLMLFRRCTDAPWASVFVAAVFGLHPLHVESVAWIAERKDVLSTAFLLLALLFYCRHARTRPRRAIVAATVCVTLGLLAKPMLVTAPFIMLLLDYWPLRRLTHASVRTIAGAVAEKTPLFIVVAAMSAITLRVQSAAQATSSLDALPLSMRLENAVTAYVRYMGKTLWPTDLVMYYPHPLGSQSTLLVASSLALLAIVTAAAWRVRKRAPYVLVGWFWYLGTLVPVIGIVQVGTQAIADRYTYVPMLGLLIMLAWSVRDLLRSAGSRHTRSTVAAASTAAVLALAWMTVHQVRVWRNSESLFAHTLAIMPDNPTANMGLGLLRVHEARYSDAVPLLETALAQKHRPADAQYHLGIARQHLGELDEARTHYEAAVQLDPAKSKAWNNLGVVLDALNQPADAEQAFRRSCGIDPLNAEARFNLGALLIKTNRAADAETVARDALQRMPDHPDMHFLLGLSLLAQNKAADAAQAFRAALAIDPTHKASEPLATLDAEARP